MEDRVEVNGAELRDTKPSLIHTLAKKAIGNVLRCRRQSCPLINKHMEGSLTGKAHTMAIPITDSKTTRFLKIRSTEEQRMQISPGWIPAICWNGCSSPPTFL